MTNETALRASLGRYFGHEDFRPGQLDVLRHVLQGRHTLAVMPTGAGKSLCYQLPAVLLDGLTLVVSPLVALMQDQVAPLERRGIAADCLNSAQSESRRAEVERGLSERRYRLLFVAPERFASASFRRALRGVPLSLVAVDEAHCISEWGHSFRPAYERLGELVTSLRPPRLLALTATATAPVRADIVRALRMHNPHVAVAGFDRPNIHLEVHRLTTEAEKRDTLLAAVRGHRPAIVYAATRRQASLLARMLQQNRVRAGAYHAGLGDEERRRTQRLFSDGQLEVVCATNAFGLGIDKSDVRLVLHTEPPRSIEAYYQEVGRAGRDGLPATAALLFAPKDLFLLQRLVRLANPSPRAVRAVFHRLRTAGEPLALEQLSRGHAPAVSPAEGAAAIAFLEGLDLLDKRYVAPAAAVRSTRPQPSALYTARPGAALASEHLRGLAARARYEQGRLFRMLALARGRDCRRRSLLGELGETRGRGPCGGCDVCSGHRLVAVRSGLVNETRRPLRAWTGRKPLDTVRASQPPKMSGDGAGVV